MRAKKLQTVIQSPVGPLRLETDGDALTAIRFALSEEGATFHGRSAVPSPFREVARQLDAYFGGELREFDLGLAPEGTPFQLAAWHALRRIPYGQTLTYAQQAQRLGRPTAVRAVGAANARNPLPIVVPCHRVVASNGSLAGYAGGLSLKRYLLQLEGAV